MNGFHHLDEAAIVCFASGTSSNWLLPVIANHVSHCTECRQSVRRAVAIGGALLEAVAPQRVPAGVLEAIFERIEHIEPRCGQSA